VTRWITSDFAIIGVLSHHGASVIDHGTYRHFAALRGIACQRHGTQHHANVIRACAGTKCAWASHA